MLIHYLLYLLYLLFITKSIQGYNVLFSPFYHRYCIELPTISYEKGIQHLHTPDVFLPASGLVPVGFYIDDIYEPVVSNDNAVMDVDYISGFNNKYKVRFLASKRHRSDLFFYENNILQMIANVCITSINKNKGHNIHINVKTLNKNKLYGMNLNINNEEIRSNIIHMLPPVAKWEMRHPNVLKYIKLINTIDYNNK